MSRRRFLKASIYFFEAGTALVVGIPVLTYLSTPLLQRIDGTWVGLGALADLRGRPDPFAVRFSYESTRGYTAQKRTGLLYVVEASQPEEPPQVLSPICTHKGCNVSWAPQQQQFACPCHGGRYDRSGKVVSGPPPRPLQTLVTQIRESTLFVRVEEGQA